MLTQLGSVGVMAAAPAAAAAAPAVAAAAPAAIASAACTAAAASSTGAGETSAAGASCARRDTALRAGAASGEGEASALTPHLHIVMGHCAGMAQVSAHQLSLAEAEMETHE